MLLSTRRTLAGILVLLCCAPPAGAEDTPRNTKPFSRFKILLSSAFFNDSLPFDVPFILWGDVPESTDPTPILATSVTLRVGELRGGLDCNTGNVTYRPPMRSEARTWTPTDYTDRGIPAPTDVTLTTRRQFEFMVPELKPKKVYCFLFQKEPGRRMTNAETAVLARRLLPAYRAFLQRSGQMLAFDTAGVETLRQSLIRDLFGATQLEGFRAVPGSIFDPDARPEDVFRDFTDLAVQVLNAHNNVVIGLAGANDVPRDDLSALTEWTTSTVPAPLTAGPLAADAKAVFGLNTDGRTKFLLGTPLGLEDSLTVSVEEAAGFQVKELYTAADPCPAGSGPLTVRCKQLEESRDRVRNVRGAMPAGRLRDLMDATIGDLERRKVVLLDLQAEVNRREVAMSRHLGRLQGLLSQSILVMTTTLGNLQTRKKWYLGMDTGIATAPTIDEVFPYVGTNVYFRPINMEAPPRGFLTRFSALFGFTWTENLVKDGERAPLYADNVMILLGAGLRLTEFIRLGGGALVLKSVDPNPFVDHQTIRLTPYVALSADIDLAGVMGAVFGGDKEPPVIGAGTQPK